MSAARKLSCTSPCASMPVTHRHPGARTGRCQRRYNAANALGHDRLQLDAPVGSLVAVSRLDRPEEEGTEEEGTEEEGARTGSGAKGDVPGGDSAAGRGSVGRDDDVVPPAKIIMHRVLLSVDAKPIVSAPAKAAGEEGASGVVGGSGGSGAGAAQAVAGEGAGRLGGQGGGLKDLLETWLTLVSPVRKRRVCVIDGALLVFPPATTARGAEGSLPLDAQSLGGGSSFGSAGGEGVRAGAPPQPSTLVCLSLRQGNGQVYPSAVGGSLRYFGLWLQGVQVREVKERWAGEYLVRVHVRVCTSDCERVRTRGSIE